MSPATAKPLPLPPPLSLLTKPTIARGMPMKLNRPDSGAPKTGTNAKTQAEIPSTKLATAKPLPGFAPATC